MPTMRAAALRNVACCGVLMLAMLFARTSASSPEAQGNQAISMPITVAQVAPTPGASSDARHKLEALVKAAQAEGEVTLYSAVASEVSQRVANAFTAKYGVKVRFARFST